MRVPLTTIDSAGVGDEEDGEVAVREQGGAAVGAVVDDDGGEGLQFFLGDAIPQFTGEGEVGEVEVDAGLVEHRCHKFFVHRDEAAVGVEVARSEFDGFAQHHAQGDILDAEFVGNGQRLADVVAIFHKGLLGKVGV